MNYSDIYKLLDKPEEWEVTNKGTFIEQYEHSSGFRCFAKMFFVTFRAPFIVERSNLFRWVWSIITFKEYRFRKALRKLGKL